MTVDTGSTKPIPTERMVDYFCGDECGERDQMPATANSPPPGWQAMQIRKGYRCPACVKKLNDVNTKGTS